MPSKNKCLSCGVLHKKAKWGKFRTVTSHDGVLYIGSKRVLAPHSALLGLVGTPEDGLCGTVCGAASTVSRPVSLEVA
jgi:hypothetical protein